MCACVRVGGGGGRGGGGGGGGGDTCVIMEGGHSWCYVKEQYTVPRCLEKVLL